MAEAIFADLVKKHSLPIEVDSAGTASYHVGSTPDSRSVAECKRNGVPVNHRARQLQRSDFDTFDYILVMDESNLSDAKSKQPKGSKAKVQLFGEFIKYAPGSATRFGVIIDDPYYGGPDGFATNFEQCYTASLGFLKFLGHDISQ